MQQLGPSAQCPCLLPRGQAHSARAHGGSESCSSAFSRYLLLFSLSRALDEEVDSGLAWGPDGTLSQLWGPGQVPQPPSRSVCSSVNGTGMGTTLIGPPAARTPHAHTQH